MFIDISKYNDSRQEKNLIPKKEDENVAIVTCGMSQDHVVKTEETTAEEEDYIKEFEICRICSVASCLTPFKEKAHLMQLFQNITNIDVEADTNSSKKNSICNKCISELEKISLFISLSLNTNMKLESAFGRYEALKTEDFLEDKKCNVKFESIPIRKEVKTENYFDEKAYYNEGKDLDPIIDIKENILYSSEDSSIETPLAFDLFENKFSAESLFSSVSFYDDIKLENTIGGNEPLKTKDYLEETAIDDSKEIKLESILGRNEVKVDNNSNEYLCCSESKDLHTVVDIMEEDIYRPGASVRKHTQHGLEFCSETNSEEKPSGCDPCETEFSTESHLKISPKLLKVNLEVLVITNKFKCDCCEKSFTHRASFKRHVLNHTGQKPFKCDFCKKCFSRKSSFNRHMLIHTGEKTFKCDCCTKSFTCKNDLKSHILTHNVKKPFECDRCEKSFFQKQHLSRHLLTHTKQKPFRCDRCEKSFAVKDRLKNHSLTHTGQNPFICACCKKSFNRRGNLKRHMLTHTGEKSFKCDTCQKSFAEKRTLKDHLLTHTGEKPFKCDRCKQSFTLRRSLKKHMRRSHLRKAFQ